MNSRPTFPDDPELSALKEELARTRDECIRTDLDQLDAARAVNDADRVLEIYQELVPSLDEDRTCRPRSRPRQVVSQSDPPSSAHGKGSG